VNNIHNARQQEKFSIIINVCKQVIYNQSNVDVRRKKNISGGICGILDTIFSNPFSSKNHWTRVQPERTGKMLIRRSAFMSVCLIALLSFLRAGNAAEPLSVEEMSKTFGSVDCPCTTIVVSTCKAQTDICHCKDKTSCENAKDVRQALGNDMAVVVCVDEEGVVPKMKCLKDKDVTCIAYVTCTNAIPHLHCHCVSDIALLYQTTHPKYEDALCWTCTVSANPHYDKKMESYKCVVAPN